jgi:C-terminal processing protease CtpA/Prc
MQAQKGSDKQGQFIGKVDKDTPADAAGLRQGDRIVEVNGSNVEKASHKEVVDKIKSVPDVVQLLVVDDEADKYFIGKDIKVSSELAECFDRKESPKTKPGEEKACML